MPQDSTTGGAAARWGTETGRAIARALGAAPVSKIGNEFRLGGTAVTIRTARASTTSVGVTYAMLARVQRVIAAWETTPNVFDLSWITAEAFSAAMRESRSKAGSKVGLVARSFFEKHGNRMGTVGL